MPAKRILEVLGMSAKEWGNLPYDPNTGTSPERKELLTKAHAIIQDVDGKKAGDSLHSRMTRIEEKMKTGGKGVDPEPIMQRLDGLGKKIEKMEKRLDALERTPAPPPGHTPA